jgi:hypothetical protein
VIIGQLSPENNANVTFVGLLKQTICQLYIQPIPKYVQDQDRKLLFLILQQEMQQKE